MLNYFNDAYPSFGLNPLLSHFSLLVNYLAIVTFILILRIKNYLNKNETIILIITSSSPFFFNNFLFSWDFMYDQFRYFKYSGYNGFYALIFLGIRVLCIQREIIKS